MPGAIHNPFGLGADELQRLLKPDMPLIPELEMARGNLAALRAAPQTQVVLAQTKPLLDDIAPWPPAAYASNRPLARTGERGGYETRYFLKRTNLAAVALRLFLEEDGELRDHVQDYLWGICEESNWVLPAHERDAIDLF